MTDKRTLSMALNRLIRLLVYIVLLFIPLSNPLMNQWVKTAIQWIILSTATIALIDGCIHWTWKWKNTAVDKPILAIFCWCLLTSVVSSHRYTSFWALADLAGYITFFYITLYAFRTREHTRTLIWVMIGGGVLVSSIGLAKMFFSNPFPWWNYDFIRGNAGQMTATFSNKSHLAGYIVMLLPVTIAFLLTGVRHAQRMLLIAISILFLFIVLKCMARSAWVAGFCGMFCLSCLLSLSGYYEKRKIFGFFIGIAVLVFVFSLFDENLIRRLLSIGTDDLSGRIPIWKHIFTMIQEHPFFGTGPSTFKFAFARYHPPAYDYRHVVAANEYIQFISEAGVPIVIGIVWFMAALGKKGFHRVKHPSRLVRGTAVGAISALVAVSIDAFANINFHLPAVVFNVCILAALIVSPGLVPRSFGTKPGSLFADISVLPNGG